MSNVFIEHLKSEVNVYLGNELDNSINKKVRDNLCPGNQYFKNRIATGTLQPSNQYICYDSFLNQTNGCVPATNRLKTNPSDQKHNAPDQSLSSCATPYPNDFQFMGQVSGEASAFTNFMQNRIRLRAWVVRSGSSRQQDAGFTFGNTDAIQKVDGLTAASKTTTTVAYVDVHEPKQNFVPVNVLALFHERFVSIDYVKEDTMRYLDVRFRCPTYLTRTQVGSVTQFWKDRKVRFSFPAMDEGSQSAVYASGNSNYRVGALLDDQFLPDHQNNGGNPRLMAYWDPYRRENLLQVAVNYFLRRFLCKAESDKKKRTQTDTSMDVVVGTGLFRLKFRFTVRVRNTVVSETEFKTFTDLSVQVRFETNPFPFLSGQDQMGVTSEGNVMFQQSGKQSYFPQFRSSLDGVSNFYNQSWDQLRGDASNFSFKPQVDNLSGFGKANLIDPSLMFGTTVGRFPAQSFRLGSTQPTGMICLGSFLDCEYPGERIGACEDTSTLLFSGEQRLQTLLQKFEAEIDKKVATVDQLLEYKYEYPGPKQYVSFSVCFSLNLKHMLFLRDGEWMMFTNGLHDGHIFQDACSSRKDFISDFHQHYCRNFVYDPRSEKSSPTPPSFRQDNKNPSQYYLSGLYIDPICNLVSSGVYPSIDANTSPTNWEADPFQIAVFRSVMNQMNFGTKSATKLPIKQSLAKEYFDLMTAPINPSQCGWLLPINGFATSKSTASCNNDIPERCNQTVDTQTQSKDDVVNTSTKGQSNRYPTNSLMDVLMFGVNKERFREKPNKFCVSEEILENVNVSGLGNRLQNNSTNECGDTTPPTKNNNLIIYTVVGVTLFLVLVFVGVFMFKLFKKK